MAISEK